MDNEMLFYVFGGVAAVSAVLVTLAGLKLKNFPGRMFPLVVVWFAAFAVGASTFSVLQAKDHEAHDAHEKTEHSAEDSSSGPYENEGGALGGEREELEEEAEEEAEGPEEEEPVGPVEKSGESGQGGESGGQEGSSGATGADSGGGTASATTLQLAADPSALLFDKEELSAKAGEVTIDFENPSAVPHNVVIEKDGEEIAGTPEITEDKASVSTELEAGTYEYVCTVPGHEDAGMAGTLTVE
jgi:plastocyanin